MIGEPLLETLRELVGKDHVSTSAPDRDSYSRDLWPRSLLELLDGHPFTAPPDAVVWPGTTEEVAAVVKACAQARTPIVPFGAGSGVCGGTLAIEGGVSLDIKRLKRLRRADASEMVIEVEAGRIGELLERDLERLGMTLGHFPSSILCSTVGGWLATRSAGQCSTRYGKIEDMCLDLEVVTGDGAIHRTPRADLPGYGPSWNELFLGSEGTLGIITAATLKVHPQPAHRCFHGYLVPDLEAGFALMRETMQAGLRPAVLRMYDPLDTRLVGADPHGQSNGGGGGPLGNLKHVLLASSSGRGGFKRKALRWALGNPRIVNQVASLVGGACLVVMVSEGERDEALAIEHAVNELAREVGAQDLGEGPGRSWLAHRHDVSFKVSKAYLSGLFADTFEVATTWSQIRALYDAVRSALSPYVLVMAHFSHAYPGGCSIYFTMSGSASTPSEMKESYDQAWQAGLDAALGQQAAIAHHHGVGLSRSKHLPLALGEAQRWFDAIKPIFDPAGILNPGKLFPPPA